MSWETVIPSGGSLSPLQLVGLGIAALGGIALIAATIGRRRAETRADVARDDEARNDDARVDETHSMLGDDAPTVVDEPQLEELNDDNFLKGAFSSHANDPKLHEIPAFTSLPSSNPSDREQIEPDRADRDRTVDVPLQNASSGDVSSLLFRLLGTKARIVELERAERTKSRVLASTREALESLKGSLEGSSSELHEELDEMHELISGELSASHQSAESVQQLKQIIEAQYDLLNKPDAVYSAELLLAKQSYVESIDASLDRRLKNAERRETEFALGKERIMALKKQMLRLKDTEIDSTRAH